MNQIQTEEEKSKAYNLTTTKGLVDLTPDNVAKVEAMIRYDSAYLKSGDSNAEPIPLHPAKGNDFKYQGSTAYWITQFKEYYLSGCKVKGWTYKEILKNIVRAIDRENSTHLNSDKVGLNQITERLEKIQISDLVQLIKNPGIKYKLIEVISYPTDPNLSLKTPKGNTYKSRSNFSFATKFCHYMAFYLFEGKKEQDNFSIYDQIMDDSIRKYAFVKGSFSGNYKDYINLIDKIIFGKGISRNGFDHLLWYYYKGRPN